MLNLALPLGELESGDPEDASGQFLPVEITPQSYGRRVTSRMRASAQAAVALARLVGEGEEHVSAFARPRPSAANATELAALAALGGPSEERIRYHVRFAQSPLMGRLPVAEPTLLVVTPADQRVFEDASEFLRTKQPRSGVTVSGLVVRLSRVSKTGRGDIVIQGIDDDSGVVRRFRVSLSEADYSRALEAHRLGSQVVAVGDVEVKSTQRQLKNVASFDVLADLYDS